MVAFGLKTMSELHSIMLRFANIGPQAHQKAIKAAADAEEGSENPAGIDNIEVEEGETSPKEFDYLLGMPMWSLTEEKVE